MFDFNGHYDWTFTWIDREGGTEALAADWHNAISRESQSHAPQVFQGGSPGMAEYWEHTLDEEGADYTFTTLQSPDTGREVVHIDIRDCPSKGFLLRSDISFSEDYCSHCVGWIGPALVACAGSSVVK